MKQIFRTEYGLVEARVNPLLGVSFVHVPDIEAKNADNYLNHNEARFTLSPNLAPLPYKLWSAFVKLAFDFTKKQWPLEVAVMLLRDFKDGKEWKMLVPRQAVSGGSVERIKVDAGSAVECIDILTGEQYVYPTDPIFTKWGLAGSAHSHSNMALSSFSATDDTNELHVPGVHILISNISLSKNTYIPTVSVVHCGQRHIIKGQEVKQVLDLQGEEGEEAQDFHPDVLTYITNDMKLRKPGLLGWSGKGYSTTKAGRYNKSKNYSNYGYGLCAEMYEDYFGFEFEDDLVIKNNKGKTKLNKTKLASDIKDELDTIRISLSYLEEQGIQLEDVVELLEKDVKSL